MRISKRKIFLGLPVALLSVEIYLGMLAGYLAGKFLAGKKVGQPPAILKSLVFGVGSYKLHIHHWMYGSGILISSLSLNFLPPWPQFSLGILGGVILQGIITYSDWYQIIKK